MVAARNAASGNRWSNTAIVRATPSGGGLSSTSALARGRRPALIKPTPLGEVSASGHARMQVPMNEVNRVVGGGLVPGSLVLIGGDPGIGKCLAGSERVLDPVSGAWLPIAGWAEQLRPVLALDEADYRLSPQPVALFHDQGVRPVVEVTTRLGRTLRCTPGHPVLTPDGWRPVGEALRPGTRVAAPRALPYFGADSMDEDAIKLVAYALSDGSAHAAISVTSALPEVAADLVAIAQRLRMALRVYDKPGNRARQYRFVLPAGERLQARRELVAALTQVRDSAGRTWAGWARAAGVNQAKLNTWRYAEAVPSLDELQRLADAAGVALADLAPTARDRAEKVSPLARFLDKLGLRYATARTKAVPECIFRLPRPQLALFLKILFSCDGSVYMTHHGRQHCLTARSARAWPMMSNTSCCASALWPRSGYV